jgi:ureidoacrylate peracid hydrolase
VLAVHQVEYSAELVEFLRQQRSGRLHTVDHLDPQRTAHVVIDLQNGFMETGALAETPVAREIVPHVNAISRAVREMGATNAFLRFTTPDDEAEWSTFYGRYSPAFAGAHRDAFMRGSHSWDLWPELDIAPTDLKVDKRRFGAFIEGTCDLDRLLRAREIDTLIITGTLSNCCCESTARDAMQRNYRVIFVSDANAALSDAEHNAALHNMAFLFADVMTTAEVVFLADHAGRVATEPSDGVGR